MTTIMSDDDEHEHHDHEHDEEEHDHHHAEDVTSVGIRAKGDLDEKKLSDWLGTLAAHEGPGYFPDEGRPRREGPRHALRFSGRPHARWTASPTGPGARTRAKTR